MKGRFFQTVVGLLLASLILPAQQRASKIYTSADGLGHDRVYRIVSDQGGFLWFCTLGGLTRFDGQHFSNFGAASGAPFESVNDLVEGSRDDYWLASRGKGLIRLAASNPLEPANPATSNRFRLYRIGSDAASNYPNVLYRGKSDVVWIGTDSGLYRLSERDGSVQILPSPLALPEHPDRLVQVFGLTEAPDGTIYAATNFGVVRLLPDGRRVFYRFPSGYRVDELGPILFRDGVLWMAQAAGLVLLRPAPSRPNGPEIEVDDALSRTEKITYPKHFTIPTNPGQSVIVQLDPDPTKRYVFAVHELSGGRIWLASLAGMFEFSRGEMRRILTNVPFNYVLEIGHDTAGNAWLATDNSGVAEVESRGSAIFGRADGLGSIPNGAIVSNTGDVLVPSWPRELSVFSGDRFQTIELKLAPKADITGLRSAMLQDHVGEWWVATSAGLYRFPRVSRPQGLADVSPAAVLTRRQGLADDEIWCPFEDAVGDVWMGGARSSQPTASRWERRTGRVFRYSIADGLPEGGDRLRGIVQDSEKSLWFAFSEGGLARYRDGRFRAFGEAQGLPSMKIAGIAADPHGRVWCSIVGHGLVRIDDSSGPRLTLAAYSLTEKVADNAAGSPVFADAKGRIYCGLLHGVDRLDPSTGAVTRYGPADGVPEGPLLNIAGDGKGAIWVSARRTVARILPDSMREVSSLPALLSGLRVSGIDYLVSATGARSLNLGQLPYQKNSLQIDFLSLSFTTGQSPLFQYQLEGADSGWSAPTPLNTVNYANLSPGNYRFLVRQVSRDENAVAAPAQLAFRILPPFWKQNWFLGSILVLGVGAVSGFERYRANKVRQLRTAMEGLRKANEALDIESASSRILAQSTDEGALPSLLETLSQKTGWDRTVLWVRDRQTARLHLVAEWPGLTISPGAPETGLLPGPDLPGKVISTGQFQWIATPIGRACFPIVVGESILGVIELHSNGPRECEPALAATLFTVSGMIGQWMERLRAERALLRSREERLAEIERVRRRIAVDLHDDIGSSLSQISVLSEVARREVAGSSRLERPLEIIAGSSRELIDSMSDIVWAINPQRDHLADLLHRIRRFAADNLTARKIEFTMELPNLPEDIKLEGNLRREVFLIFKEGLNNAMRHSGCTRAEIALRLENHTLRLHMHDNGKGFDTALPGDGHGLTSMSSRALGIGARFEIVSQPGKGAEITLEVPLNPAMNC
jgi:signal transduction histidine kinase/ligand-binding sensor domain-containing protein